MLDQLNPYCPRCGHPLSKHGPGGCAHCGARFSEPQVHTVDAMLSLPRRPCQACHRSMLVFASVCARCRIAQDPEQPVPRLLPPKYQDNLDHRSREDDIIYLVLSAGVDRPEPESVLAGLSAGRVLIHDAGSADWNRGHRPVWEKQLFVESPERPRKNWETSTAGLRPRRGERVHIWLEQTGLPVDMGLDVQLLDGDLQQRIRDSAWTIGLHCESTDAPPWNTLLLMRLVGQLLKPLDAVVIEASTGRLLSEIWREAAEVRPPSVRDCYRVVIEQQDGMAWLRTRGLPRWGCFELEVLDCPEARIGEATHLIHAAAGALIAADDLPPPWRPLYFRNGAAFAWVPFEQIAEQITPGVPGSDAASRGHLKHVTVVLVSPYFAPETYAQIAAQPEPPSQRVVPEIDVAETIEHTQPPLPAAAHPRALAALISFFLPGAAQIWLGQRRKGTALLVLSLLTCGGLGLLCVVSAFDAWRLAGRLAAGERPSAWNWF